MKRILSLILCFVLLTALLPVSVTGHGSVTEVVPEGYIPIYTPEELSAIREDLTANYILMADIDLTEALAEGGSLYNPSRGWESIGDGNHPDSMGYPFTGIFDGNGHRIRGIYGKGYASGLFCNNQGTIKNLTITSGSFEVYGNVGAIARYNYGLIENCHNGVDISVTESCYVVGGITGGQYENGVIRNCSNSGSITVDDCFSDATVGGIVGYCADNSIIDSVFNAGEIYVSTKSLYGTNKPLRAYGTICGGIVGILDDNASVSNAYNTRLIKAHDAYVGLYDDRYAYAGGIVALQRTATAVITNCYNTGATSTSSEMGAYCFACNDGICAVAADANSITNCYYYDPYGYYTGIDWKAAGTNTCVELSLDGLISQQSYVGFDFDSVWIMRTYPTLRGICADSVYDFDPPVHHSLNLGSDISLNYLVAVADVKNYKDLSLEYSYEDYDGNTHVGTVTGELSPVKKGDYYYFTLDGLCAVQIGTEIKATLHATSDLGPVSSPVDSYSVSTYAYNRLQDPDTPQKLAKLCAELLRYGATAQSFKGYHTDALADSRMTEEHRALLTELSTVKFRRDSIVLEDLESPSVTWQGRGLSMDSKVTIRFIIDTKNYAGDPEALTLHLYYVDRDGYATGTILKDPALYEVGSDTYYVFDFDKTDAAQMRTVVTAAVYEGDTQVSCTARYSIASYGYGKTGELEALCRAMLSYGDAAKAFLA